MIWKVVSLLMVLGLTSIGGAYYATLKMADLDRMYTQILDGPEVTLSMLARANRMATAASVAVYRNIAAVTPADNVAASQALATAVREYDSSAEEARGATPAYADKVAGLIKDFHRAVETTCAATVKLASDASDPEAMSRASQSMLTVCEPAINAVISAGATLGNTVKAELKVLNDAGTDASVRAGHMTLAAIAIATLAVIGVAVVLVRGGIVAPLRGMMGVMEAMGRGDLGRAVEGTERADEIGAMSNTLELLREQLGEAEVARQQQAAREEQERQVLARRSALSEAFVGRMRDLASGFAQSSGEVAESARNLSETADETSRQAQAVASAAEEAATNVQTVAASSEELAASVREITGQVSHSADVADIAFNEAEASNARIGDLSAAAAAIGDVINLIKGIADQTNLLALNATIEAARAGEMGKGFAVVAAEVKQLADQTAKATADISSKVNEIQQATHGTVASMTEIVRVVSDIKQISSAIAGAVEEQGAATGEIAQNCQQAATGTQQVTQNIGGVGRAAEMTGAASSQLLTLSQGLSGQATDLRNVVETFVRDLNAA
ncbi:methyl-accepting chemotaxis protein [Azorhizobium doebereinerae]|uniref:methyl-accepting chemotaxis protein n=1 Tax=Azorhizobium doebereinerae TaxID=281091 RepID=UPI001AEC2F4A|nr:HAMP domain-containing methyl-accepting chemotaxis protein [Azorhizobium doebereinerae]